MPARRQPIIAPEGWIDILILLTASATLTYFFGWLWAAPMWLLFVFVTQFFRDPVRDIPAEPRAVICPADGRVVAVDVVRDPYLEREARRISIFMNVFNVHSNRSPVDGKIREIWYQRGSFLNAALDKASKENERNALWIRTDAGDDVVVVQVAGLIARRIRCYRQPGDRVGHGERFGFIRYGSRVDVYLPDTATPRVALGDRVKSGRDIIAVLARAETPGVDHGED
ncbi:MAG: phosphatidylserine decarboxylase [Acidiferrobacteraceae bacterium]|jgi:phosphatidylserine decarboxylase